MCRLRRLQQVTDFVSRAKQLVEVVAQVVAACNDGIDGMSTPVWMGAFFMPGAFLTVRKPLTPCSPQVDLLTAGIRFITAATHYPPVS